MPDMNFLPMQPVLPDLGSALAGGIDAGSNVAQAFTRAKQATIAAAIAHQQMQHAAIMNPLMEQQQQVNADTAGAKAAAGIGLTKAQMENLQSETHNRDMLTPFIQQMMSNHAQMFNAAADKLEAYKNGIVNFLHGVPGFGPKVPGLTAKAAAAAGPKPGEPAALLSVINPANAADRAAFISFLAAYQHKNVDPTGMMLPQERDSLNSAAAVFGNRMLDAELEKRQASQAKQQLGQQSFEAMKGFLSKFMGKSADGAAGPTTQPAGPTTQPVPAIVQTPNGPRQAIPDGRFAGKPQATPEDINQSLGLPPGGTLPRMGFLGLGGPAASAQQPPTPFSALPDLQAAGALPTPSMPPNARALELQGAAASMPPNPASGVQAGGVPSQPLGVALAPTASIGPTITTHAAYDALPVGAPYLDANGKPHIKRAAAGAGG